jgi:hypothetical protein
LTASVVLTIVSYRKAAIINMSAMAKITINTPHLAMPKIQRWHKSAGLILKDTLVLHRCIALCKRNDATKYQSPIGLAFGPPAVTRQQSTMAIRTV